MERMQTKTQIIGKEKFTVKYGFHYLQGNSRPHFSVTLTILEKKNNGQWQEVGGGAAHDEVTRVFPELVPLIKWHLVDDDGRPTHYVANATYWLEMEFGISKWKSDGRTEPLDAFKSSTVFGALPEDTPAALSALLAPLCDSDKIDRIELAERVRAFCANRLPALAAKMREDMEAFGVQYIEQSEYMNSVA